MPGAQTPELLSQIPVQQSVVWVQKSPPGLHFGPVTPMLRAELPAALVSSLAPVPSSIRGVALPENASNDPRKADPSAWAPVASEFDSLLQETARQRIVAAAMTGA